MPIPCISIISADGTKAYYDADNPFPVAVQGFDDAIDLNVTVTNLDEWQIWLVSDTTANDSDKTLAVPAGYEYQVLWLYVEYTSTATAGNRQLEVRIYNSAGVMIGQVRPGVTQAASLTYYYMFAPSLADLTGVRDTDFIMTPFPPTVFLPALYYIRVFDNNAVAAGADDMTVHMQVARRQV